MTPFDVVLVPFPFADLTTTKQRPCLLLECVTVNRLANLLIVAMMTSQIDGRSFPHDVSIKDWQGAGLPKPTLIRLAKLVTVEAKLVRRTLGRLTPHDQTATKTAFQRLFRAWVA